MPDLRTAYQWELELLDGSLLRQADGQRWQDADPAQVLRASLVPAAEGQRVDVFCHPERNRFVRRFGRGYLRQRLGFHLGEYAHCIETTRQRTWVLSGGRVVVTPPDCTLRV